MSHKNKTVFITGGASGIGFETAKKFLDNDSNVVIFSKNLPLSLSDIFKDDNKILLIEGDVTKREEVSSAMKEAVKKFSSLDLLINNAGVAKRENFLETTEKDWDFVIDVNLKGAIICIQEFAKACGKENDQKKMVINIASGAGILGIDGLAVYSATKAGIINLSQSLDKELKNLGIKFISVCPGSTDTQMFKNLFPEETPHHTPDQVADVIYKVANGEIIPDERLIVDVFYHQG